MTQRQGYRIRVGEREHEVEVEIDGAGQRRVLVDGQPYEVAQAGGHALRVSPEHEPSQPAGRRQIEVTLAGEPRPREAWVAGVRTHVEVQTEQEARLAAALGKGAGGVGSGSLTAPMPGRVVKVLVSQGQIVAHGTPVIIVEAMKMENELQAPASGVVKVIAVSEGATVDAGQVLMEIEAQDN
jgi:biotin carboxyl carrier protein